MKESEVKVGQIVRIKKDADAPYKGRLGEILDSYTYQNGRVELEIRILSAAATRYGKPVRTYGPSEVESVTV
jgi:hypothetical protein